MLKKILLLALLPILFFEVYFGFLAIFGEKILPKIAVGGISLSGKTQVEAKEALEKAVKSFSEGDLKINVVDHTFEIPVSELEPRLGVEKAVKEAYSIGHSTNLVKNFTQILNLVKNPVKLKIDYSANPIRLEENLVNIAKKIDTGIAESKLEVEKGKVEFQAGFAGQKLDVELVKKQILENFSEIKLEPINATISTVEPEIPESLAEKAIAAAQKFVGNKVILKGPDEDFEISDNEILSLASPVFANNEFSLTPNRDKVVRYTQNLAKKIDQVAIDAKFQFDGKKATVFQPADDGTKLDQEKAAQLVFDALSSLENSPQVNLPVSVTPPKIETSDVNNLGIKELLGRGVSNFAGSAQERVHNIKLATSRINGTLIPPGQAFTFNQTIGEISVATGYTSAYIISKGRTILGEGGGVCQVSTTAFRAAVNSGLEIVRRVAHAYRVRYYEQAGHKVGLDATIFIPTVDLQFRNDTGNYILIQAYTRANELYFDFYGASDGRIVEVSKPVVANVRPPPPPIYEEDSTIPKGVTKQIDFQATGATVEVRRTVYKNGQVLYSDVFKSNYRPWQAKFLKGTGPS